MNSTLRKYDDLNVVSRDLSRSSGFTLTGLVHNEMYFLAPFLAHYRALGVERFIFIDDRSTDGTSDFLRAQEDVMVLKSERKYGDRVDPGDARALGLSHERVELVWRMLLLEKYATGRWSLHLDADEFLDLPEGTGFADIAAKLETQSADAIWASMIDMYPATLADLQSMKNDAILDLDRAWYFDGVPHLRLRTTKPPKIVFPGSRARLLAKFHLNRKTTPLGDRLRRLFGLAPRQYNNIRKPVLLRWRAGGRFNSAHSVSLGVSNVHLLALRHYKFNGSIAERIHRAGTTGGNTGGGAEYKDLTRLFAAMAAADGAFGYARSVRHTGFCSFRDTGNTVGFDREPDVGSGDDDGAGLAGASR